MPKYRKKPVVIEAVQHRPTNRMGEMPRWFIEAWKDGAVRGDGENLDVVLIDTLEGTMRADPVDYVIKGVQNEIYPCKPEIFEATYDLVESSVAAAKQPRPEGRLDG